MRVTMVIQVFAPVLGGAQRQVERLGAPLARRGVDVDVVTRRPAGTPTRATAPGLTIHRVGPEGASGARASIGYSALGTARVVRLRPDVIHAHDLLSPSTVALAASTAVRAPVVVKVLSGGLGGDIDRLLRKPAGAARLRLMARRFSAFIALSDEVEEELGAHGIPAERIRRIPNGVDTAIFRPPLAGEREAARAALGVPPGELLCVYCGRFYETKHVDTLIEAARIAGVRLIAFGEGPTEERLRALADGERVRIERPVADTAPLYRAADVYVSASEAEGMSGSVLEAMGSGRVVVAAPAPGMQELLGGGAGVLAGGGDAQAIAVELARLAAHPELRERIGSAARERVVARYAIDAVADRLVALYEELRRPAPALAAATEERGLAR